MAEALGSSERSSPPSSWLRHRFSENFRDRDRTMNRSQPPQLHQEPDEDASSRDFWVQLPRMIHRDLPFHQSRNRMNVRNLDPRRRLWKLQMMDWFHTLLRLPMKWSIGLLLMLWSGMVGTFALLYWFEDNYGYTKLDCGLGLTDHESISLSGAFAFSLETCTTVGYGLPGTSTSFFERGCSGIQGTIFCEMVCSMMFNAFLFAFFFALLSKSEFRGSQIIFTDKLLINVDRGRAAKETETNNDNDSDSDSDGEDVNRSRSMNNYDSSCATKAYVRLQCYDIDSAHPLVEAHARMYFLDHRLKMHPLRLMDPNDDLGAVLYPSVPADIVHHIDHHSALCPPQFRLHKSVPWMLSSHGMVLRSLDSYTGNRNEIVCPVCGESYGTYQQWRRHFEYVSMVERKDGYPAQGSHWAYELPPPPQPITLHDLKTHIANTVSEIIVVVEAIDPQLSGSFQSLQSYKYPQDICFGQEFEKCMSTTTSDEEPPHHAPDDLQSCYSHRHGRSTNSGDVFCVDVEQFHKTTFPTRRCQSHKSYESNSTRSLIDANTPVESSLTMTRIREEASQEFQDDDSDEESYLRPNPHPPRPSRTSNYFHRSYDTFLSSLRSFRSGESNSNDNSSAVNPSQRRIDEEEELILHDRLPPYASIV